MLLNKAEYYASFTHNHPEGIKGAQAIASAIFFARNGVSKEDIMKNTIDMFQYDLSKTLDEIRPDYYFDVSLYLKQLPHSLNQPIMKMQ